MPILLLLQMIPIIVSGNNEFKSLSQKRENIFFIALTQEKSHSRKRMAFFSEIRLRQCENR